MASLIDEYRSPVRGDMVSLGGIRSRPDSAVVLRHWRQTAIAGAMVILGPEPRRLWSLTIMSTANTNNVPTYLTLGTPSLGIGIPFASPGDCVQIDSRLPWTGPINANGTGTNGNIDTFEAVLE